MDAKTVLGMPRRDRACLRHRRALERASLRGARRGGRAPRRSAPSARARRLARRARRNGRRSRAIRTIAQAELGWDDATWEREEAAYRRNVARALRFFAFGQASAVVSRSVGARLLVANGVARVGVRGDGPGALRDGARPADGAAGLRARHVRPGGTRERLVRPRLARLPRRRPRRARRRRGVRATSRSSSRTPTARIARPSSQHQSSSTGRVARHPRPPAPLLRRADRGR